jgi:hypothetical protein
MFFFNTYDAFYVAPVDTGNGWQSVSDELEVNVPLSNNTDIVGDITTFDESDLPNRVGFLALVPETDTVGLYTALSDGSALTEVAGEMVEGGNVVQLRFVKPAE